MIRKIYESLRHVLRLGVVWRFVFAGLCTCSRSPVYRYVRDGCLNGEEETSDGRCALQRASGDLRADGSSE